MPARHAHYCRGTGAWSAVPIYYATHEYFYWRELDCLLLGVRVSLMQARATRAKPESIDAFGRRKRAPQLAHDRKRGGWGPRAACRRACVGRSPTTVTGHVAGDTEQETSIYAQATGCWMCCHTPQAPASTAAAAISSSAQADTRNETPAKNRPPSRDYSAVSTHLTIATRGPTPHPRANEHSWTRLHMHLVDRPGSVGGSITYTSLGLH